MSQDELHTEKYIIIEVERGYVMAESTERFRHLLHLEESFYTSRGVTVQEDDFIEVSWKKADLEADNRMAIHSIRKA